jgi:uncharacterized protein (TIGR00369 family)
MTPEQAQKLAAAMPFSSGLGIEVAKATPEEVVTKLAWKPELCTTGGLMHGGVIMSLADSTGALCAFLNLPEGAGTTTIESKTNFFRAVREGVIQASAKPLHVGRTVIAVQTAIHDAQGKLIAQVTQSQAVLTPR